MADRPQPPIVTATHTTDATSATGSTDGTAGTNAAKTFSSAGKDKAARSRAMRREAFEARFPADRLALAGLILSLVFLFQQSVAIKTLMLLGSIAATWFSGKRFSLPATFIVSASIVAANLLLPFGKVLLNFGPILITEGALLGGIEKAVTFEGLMYLSKTCILPTLKLPGRFGSVVARAFLYYDRIIEYKGRIRPATLVSDADALMLEIWESPSPSPSPSPAPSRAREG